MRKSLSQREHQFIEAFAALQAQYPDLDGAFTLRRYHNHFPVSENEILHETHNVENRQLFVEVKDRRSADIKNSIEVEWLIRNEKLIPTMSCCTDPNSEPRLVSITAVQCCCVEEPRPGD